MREYRCPKQGVLRGVDEVGGTAATLIFHLLLALPLRPSLPRRARIALLLRLAYFST